MGGGIIQLGHCRQEASSSPVLLPAYGLQQVMSHGPPPQAGRHNRFQTIPLGITRHGGAQ